jgi:hypothetical protein
MTTFLFSKIVDLNVNDVAAFRICPWSSSVTNLPDDQDITVTPLIKPDGLVPITVRLHEFGQGTGKTFDPTVLRCMDREEALDRAMIIDATTSGIDFDQSIVLHETVLNCTGPQVALTWKLPRDKTNTREWVFAVTGGLLPTRVAVELIFSIT